MLTAFEPLPDRQLIPFGHARPVVMNGNGEVLAVDGGDDHTPVAAIADGVGQQVDERLLQPLAVEVALQPGWDDDWYVVGTRVRSSCISPGEPRASNTKSETIRAR